MQENFNYADFQELTFEEFMDLLWDSISDKVISTEYVKDNRDFVQSLSFDMYRQFQMHPNLTIRTIARLLENTFYNIFRYSAPNHDDYL